jgi:hypothetical protein
MTSNSTEIVIRALTDQSCYITDGQRMRITVTENCEAFGGDSREDACEPDRKTEQLSLETAPEQKLLSAIDDELNERPQGGIQSIGRAFLILEELAHAKAPAFPS